MEIKYALMKILPFDTKIKEEDIFVTIVSKCYVLSEEKNILQSGKSKKRYGVVFPILYNKENNPTFDKNGVCTNMTFTNYLFDTYEDAKKVRDKEIQLFLKRKAKEDSKNIDSVLENYQKVLDDAFSYEREIARRTRHLKVYREPEIDIISFLEKVSGNPREFYYNLSTYLTIEEKEQVKQFITKGCFNCVNVCCTVESDEKSLEPIECYGWTNDELIGKELLSLKFKKRK